MDIAADVLTDMPPDAPTAAPRVHQPLFTGSGREYFRIWVINLLLSLATLGIYSAWAKVRRLQYFDRNTQLAGACFDFRGDPKAVLRGRIFALILLVMYEYAFGFSIAFNIGVVAFILVALPYLVRGALRFRLANTQYRGLWLGFSGSVSGAYASYLAPVAVFLLPGLALAVYPDRPGLLILSLMPYLAWPLMHGKMKAYQHRHILFGDQSSEYDVAARRFYPPYLTAGLVFIVLSVLLFVSTRLVTAHPALAGRTPAMLAALVIVFLAFYIIYLPAGPFMQARIANLAWSNTTFPGVRIHSAIPVRGFIALQARNALLTVLTLGLYRPFAVVAAYRYRLEHTRVEFDGDVDDVMARAAAGRRNAAGDGATDALGIDLSW